MNRIDLLRPSDINVKPKQLFASRSGGVSALLLLYKDSRCDMAYLDKAFGPMGWKREHRMIGDSMFCTVSVWDNETGQWVSKEDLGTESDVEKKKGEASDAFKRACTNWGIGRELYTSPRIYVDLDEREYTRKGNEKPKMRGNVTFSVADIQYGEAREITYLVIIDGGGVVRHTYGAKRDTTRATTRTSEKKQQPTPPKQEQASTERIPLTNQRVREVFSSCKDLGTAQYVTVALGKMGYCGMKELYEDEVEMFMELTAEESLRNA